MLYSYLGKNLGFPMTKCVSDLFLLLARAWVLLCQNLFLARQEHGRQQLEVWATRGQACLQCRLHQQLSQPAHPVLGGAVGHPVLGEGAAHPVLGGGVGHPVLGP